MTLRIEVRVEVGYEDGIRDPSEADMAYGARLGAIVEESVRNSPALQASLALESLQKYQFKPPMAEGFILFVVVEVNRANAGNTLWGIIAVAMATLQDEISQTLHYTSGELLQTLADMRGLRPASTDLNELGLRWGGGVSPEERQRG